MIKTLLKIIMLFLLTSCNQNKISDFESGILWKIESKSGIESYIFGTIHLYPSNEMELSENVKSKLQNCNILALETNLVDKSFQQKIEDFEPSNSTLEFIRVIKEEYENKLIYMEGELVKISKESKIYLTGLESIDEILKIKTEANISQIKLTDKQILDNFQIMLKHYKEESIQQLYEEMIIQYGNEATKSLVDNRNENWVNDIESLIEKDKTFIAVGAGHLGGKIGILNLLQNKGYKLKRI